MILSVCGSATLLHLLLILIYYFILILKYYLILLIICAESKLTALETLWEERLDHLAFVYVSVDTTRKGKTQQYCN